MEPKIIYEDESLLVLNKPAGWVVTKVATSGKCPIIEDWLKKFNYPLAASTEERSGIVHRLDKETSGILLIAKTIEVFEYLQKEFKERKIEKEYKALVHGKLTPQMGLIQAPLGRLPWNRERFGVLPGGRESVSKYKVLAHYSDGNENYSLVSVYPQTGRTHQIRIHLRYLNHPVVADVFYAGRKVSKKDLKWCPRLFLHANKIKFIHPKTFELIKFEAEMPPDLIEVLRNLQKIS